MTHQGVIASCCDMSPHQLPRRRKLTFIQCTIACRLEWGQRPPALLRQALDQPPPLLQQPTQQVCGPALSPWG